MRKNNFKWPEIQKKLIVSVCVCGERVRLMLKRSIVSECVSELKKYHLKVWFRVCEQSRCVLC
ncbi:hypothetical protein BpHYR1_044561 [Brachionus plicatilis]|uniref:Uncharacterized protein n=1 Tax=Brachionus plicatilis TaxID=10195 RepID=A0A3M7R260_BRAPC|nr:hypothetical protein BpHYR1_044561 [Brachionus plicatilis]